MNKVVLVGNLTADPELRKTNSGTSVVTFTVAVNNALPNPDGSRGTCFMNVFTFGGAAESVAKNCKKGKSVAVDGMINQRKYTAKNGTNRTVVEVYAEHVQFLGKKKDVEPTPESPKEEPGLDLDGLDLPDDDLPF